MSGLRLDRRDDALRGGYSGPVIVPGKAAESKLILRVNGTGGNALMPAAGPRLTPEQIKILQSWIDTGAQWPAGACLCRGFRSQCEARSLGFPADPPSESARRKKS